MVTDVVLYEETKKLLTLYGCVSSWLDLKDVISNVTGPDDRWVRVDVDEMLDDRVLDLLESSYHNFCTCADVRAKLPCHVAQIDGGESEAVLRQRGHEATDVIRALVRIDCKLSRHHFYSYVL